MAPGPHNEPEGSHFAPKKAQDDQAWKLAAEVYPKLATKLAGRHSVLAFHLYLQSRHRRYF